MLFYVELPSGALVYSLLSIPTICMSRADQRQKATRHLAENLPSMLRHLDALARNHGVRCANRTVLPRMVARLTLLRETCPQNCTGQIANARVIKHGAQLVGVASICILPRHSCSHV
jgi:hypothetical protein